MADIWQQFHSLPKTIRDGVATPQVIAVIDELEARHPGVDLANLVMRIVVHEFPLAELSNKLKKEYSLDDATATEIDAKLRQVVFTGVIADYLGVSLAPKSTGALEVPEQTVTLQKETAPQNLPIPAAPVPTAPVPSMPVPAPVSAPTPVPSVQPVAVAPVIPPLPTVPELQPISPIGRLAPTTQYSEDDAVEIDRQASRLKSMSSINANQDLDTLSRTILTEENVAFSDELLDRRAVSIVKARLKEIRQTPETTAMLMREPKVGGLGLDQEIASHLAAAAERYAKELKARGMVRTPDVPVPLAPPPVPRIIQPAPAPLPPVQPDPTPMPPSVPVMAAPVAQPTPPTTQPVDIPVPVIVPVMPEVTPPPRPQPVAPPPVEVPVEVEVPAPAPVAPPMMQAQRMADRPTVADVVRPAPAQALGPAEELRSMSLIEFRRLGQGAGDAARRLLEKFAHLQHESFAVWAEAVAGWRQSDVYQLYLTIGRESLEKGMPISQIIAERGRLGQPYLSEHEFSVLADLNRQLQM